MRAGKSHGRNAGPKRPEGRFRIIGGEWRGRRFDFPALEGVRPTGDRIRETAFNWLQSVIAGARCLDLFAGSGALGLEAMSRGAGELIFVDRERRLLEAIKGHLGILGRDSGFSCVCNDAADFLQSNQGRFDLVFLDPPFGTGRVSEMCRLLVDRDQLAPGARIYIEFEAGADPDLPDGWRLLRSARAGNVGYHLAAVPEAPERAHE
jgi:16S rRNA (guanine966-N2)-methyltransferase